MRFAPLIGLFLLFWAVKSRGQHVAGLHRGRVRAPRLALRRPAAEAERAPRRAHRDRQAGVRAGAGIRARRARRGRGAAALGAGAARKPGAGPPRARDRGLARRAQAGEAALESRRSRSRARRCSSRPRPLRVPLRRCARRAGARQRARRRRGSAAPRARCSRSAATRSARRRRARSRRRGRRSRRRHGASSRRASLPPSRRACRTRSSSRANGCRPDGRSPRSFRPGTSRCASTCPERFLGSLSAGRRVEIRCDGCPAPVDGEDHVHLEPGGVHAAGALLEGVAREAPLPGRGRASPRDGARLRPGQPVDVRLK